ncbi:MAG TPA: hypothetical protein VIJ54_02550 [Actinomycetes bacterium]
MANLGIEGTDVVVRLSALEKLAAFRGNVRLPVKLVGRRRSSRIRGSHCAVSAVPARAGPE